MATIKDKLSTLFSTIKEFDGVLIKYKIYQILVLIMFSVVYFLSFDSFYSDHLYRNYTSESYGNIFIIRSTEYSQSFEAQGMNLDSIRLQFDVEKSVLKSSDKIHVTLSDSRGRTIDEVDSYILSAGRSYIDIQFSDFILDRSETYYLHFTFKDMSKNSILLLKAHSVSDYEGVTLVDDANELNVDNNSAIIEREILNDDSIGYSKVANTGYFYSSINVLSLVIHTIIYLAIIVLLFNSKLMSKRITKELYRLFLLPLFLYIAPEVLNVNKDRPLNLIYPISYQHCFAIITSLLVLYALYLLFYTLTGWGSIGIAIISLLTAVLAFVNHTKMVMRGDTLMPWDIAAAGIAMKTGSTYYFNITSRFVCGILLYLIIIILIRLTHTKYYKFSKSRVLYIVLSTAVVVVISNMLILNTKLLNRMNVYYQVYPPFQSYNENGTTLAFLLHLNNLNANVVDVGYDDSNALIEQYSAIVQDEEYSNRVNDNTVKPNVICIMSEAYADLQSIRDFNTSEPVRPFYDELMQNSINGNIAVSIFGGGTCNTEFEFLTGYSMLSLMPGASVYSFYVDKEIPALPALYRSNGYRTVALHPFDGNWWDRNQKYPYLGFDEFYTQNDFDSSASYVRRYISDYSCFAKILDIYEESEEPLFLFCVTMQNHADFSEHYDNMNYDVQINDILNADDEHYHYAENYLSLIRESDDAIRLLIESLEQSDEPTIVVFFGDHCPTLNDGFYDEILQTDVGSASLEETLSMYQTPYFIWANYDLGEGGTTIDVSLGDHGISSPNFLGQTTLDLSGIESPDSRSCLRVLQNHIGAISAAAVYDSDGNAYTDYNLLDEDKSGLIEDFLAVQYALIYFDEQ